MTLLFVIAIFTGSARAQWHVYDGSVLPDVNTSSFGTSGLAANGMVSTLITDSVNSENRYLELKTVDVADNGTWRRVFSETINAVTVIMRVKSADTLGRRVVELDVDNGGFRERLYLNREDNKLRLQHSTGFGANNEFDLPGNASVQDWHTYRLTKDAEGNVKLYFDENPVPLAEGQTTTTSSNNHFRFGDTNGSHNISALIDWIIWDPTGVYAPGEGTAIPDSLISNNWTVYDASVLPGEHVPAFTSSNVAGSGGTNTIMNEGDTASYLELITVANSDNYMWSTPLNLETKGVTLIMKVKAANDVSRRVVELDLHHNGIRERLYINREANRVRLNEGIGGGDGGEIPAPGGISLGDWNIYRLTKAEGLTKLYLNEVPVPLAEGTTGTATSNQYFRFGDGNGSHNIAALIDWIIWDQTGAYAPGEGSVPPHSMTMLSWDASLSELIVDDQLISNFDYKVKDYVIVLPTGTINIPVVSAVANSDSADITVTQANQIPGLATITVTAENSVSTSTYTIEFKLETTGVHSPGVSGFRLYPNPADSYIKIERSGDEVDTYIEIISLTGQLILRKQLLSTAEIVDIRNLGMGSYVVNLTSGMNKSSRLLIKK